MTRWAHVALPAQPLAPVNAEHVVRFATVPEKADAEQRFREILQHYGASMQRIARVYASTTDDDEDLYQEIQFQVWRSLPSFRGEANIGTWVYRVALNTALKFRRSARRRIRPVKEIVDTDARTELEPRRQDEILKEFIATLGAIDRSILLLYVEGLTQQQMADVVGMNAGAIGVRIHRIKRAFEERYTEV